MKITAFNPLIVTKEGEADDVIALFGELGFEICHTKTTLSSNTKMNVRMKDANGFHVDITEGDADRTIIRMNVDNLEEAVAFLEAHGFHRSKQAAVHDAVDTGSSRFLIMISESGFIFAVSQHITEK